MKKISEQTLFSHKWAEIKEIKTDKGSYVYHHQNWSNGEGVAILAYRRVLSDLTPTVKVIQVLGRYEICPAHDLDFELCSITGGMDKEGEPSYETAKRELLEEAGYDVDVNKLVYLGELYPSKQSDTLVHTFAVEITNEVQQEIVGDGTMGEEGAYCQWMPIELAVTESKDPILHSMIAKLTIGLW